MLTTFQPGLEADVRTVKSIVGYPTLPAVKMPRKYSESDGRQDKN